MGDYTTAHCHLLLGNPTTNIEYIKGATMADDLAKYEALAGAVENIDFDGALFQKCAKAITKLVAMVREERKWWWYYKDLAEEAEKKLSDVASAIKTTRYMDPPDGGDVSIAEQVKRMAAELAELKRKMLEPNDEMIELMVDTYFESHPDTADEEDMRLVWLAAVNHLLGDKE